MLNRSKAQIFLEDLQEKVYAHESTRKLAKQEEDEIFDGIMEQLGQKYAPFVTPDRLTEMKSAVKKEMERMKKLVPTKYEDFRQYSIVLELSKDIEAAANKLAVSIPSRPLIGTLPTGRVNAMAVAVPKSNEYLVLFESQLFIFALLMSKVIAMALPYKGPQSDKGGMLKYSTDTNDIDKVLAENQEITRRFQEVLLAYLLFGKPGIAPTYLAEGHHYYLVTVLLSSMELFVMGHEYGHIISDHFSLGQKTLAALGGIKVDEIVRNWQQEFEADRWGLQLMLTAMQLKEYDLSLSFWGADLFFSCNDIVERSVSLIHTGKPDSLTLGSHPPSSMRREMLREILKRSVPAQAAEGPIGLGIIVEQVMEKLWQSTLSQLLEIRKSGRKLAPSWQY